MRTCGRRWGERHRQRLIRRELYRRVGGDPVDRGTQAKTSSLAKRQARRGAHLLDLGALNRWHLEAWRHWWPASALDHRLGFGLRRQRRQ
ncbi:MAG: hypothetical protein E6I88_01515 [Chloroflexi bacterium]|nr:MAG: hypothetical protein E6I88_01515 [Chloroflexota bacterium]